ncbi:MAG: N-acetyltransferase [Proteobacteria bacterium]|nr:N-acetyltransferase [Pseudomonadota bacterium]MBU1710798.1 N-acetyltransferase [Pseudomonadota bacterium]
MIRDARMEDVKAVYAMLNHYSEKGLLLARSLSSLYDQLRDFKISVHEDLAAGSSRIAGVCALHVCWENLAEIRSLAVGEDFHRQGVGRALVKACLAEASCFGISRVFTLTYQPVFFEKLGFVHVDKNELPHKVWSDCIHCPKFPDCNEEAMVWNAGS